MHHEDTDDFEEDSEADEDSFETVPCPYCRDPIHEDAVQCPHCGNYISTVDAPRRLPAWWIVVGVLICLAIVLMWIVSGSK